MVKAMANIWTKALLMSEIAEAKQRNLQVILMKNIILELSLSKLPQVLNTSLEFYP